MNILNITTVGAEDHRLLAKFKLRMRPMQLYWEIQWHLFLDTVCIAHYPDLTISSTGQIPLERPDQTRPESAFRSATMSANRSTTCLVQLPRLCLGQSLRHLSRDK